MDEFAWTRQQAILINGIIIGVSAVLMSFYFIIIAYISKWYAVYKFTLFITQPCIFPQGAVQDNDHDWFVYHRICIFAVYSNEQYIS